MTAMRDQNQLIDPSSDEQMIGDQQVFRSGEDIKLGKKKSKFAQLTNMDDVVTGLGKGKQEIEDLLDEFEHEGVLL